MFGKRKDDIFIKFKELLKPFDITKFYTDDWGSYQRHLNETEHIIGKNNTQIIERKTICYSKSVEMHDIVIGLAINVIWFNTPLHLLVSHF